MPRGVCIIQTLNIGIQKVSKAKLRVQTVGEHLVKGAILSFNLRCTIYIIRAFIKTKLTNNYNKGLLKYNFV